MGSNCCSEPLKGLVLHRFLSLWAGEGGLQDPRALGEGERESWGREAAKHLPAPTLSSGRGREAAQSPGLTGRGMKTKGLQTLRWVA